MLDDRTANLRASCRLKLESLLRDAEAHYAVVRRLLDPIEMQSDDFARLYNRLELASGQFPFAPYHNYYFHDFAQPNEPLFNGIQDVLSERYVELSAREIDELRGAWLVPVNDAVKATFDKAKALYVRVASEAAVVRRLSGYEDLFSEAR